MKTRFWVEVSFGDGGEMTVRAWPDDQVEAKTPYTRPHSWGDYVVCEGGTAAAIIVAIIKAERHWAAYYD